MDHAARAARAEYGRNYRKKNRERLNAYQRDWNKRNPEKVKLYQERYWAKKAGEWYDGEEAKIPASNA